jgi:putative addiction module component (TIGR02574 family)
LIGGQVLFHMEDAIFFDFSHLTPAERIELAEQLWDSLPVQSVEASDAQLQELLNRREALERDGDMGEAWENVLDEIEKYGA